MKKLYLKEEEKMIDNKKFVVKTLPSSLGGEAKGNNVIEVSENLKSYLGEEGYNSILLHEAGHLDGWIRVTRNVPSILAILFVLLLFLKVKNMILVIEMVLVGFMFAWFILQPFFTWTNEILADRFAIKRMKNPRKYLVFMKKVYCHPGYPGNVSWVYRNIQHPPKKIRFWFIKKFSRNIIN